MNSPLLLRPLKAIRANCIGCMGNQLAEVRRCECISCPLWPYRMGRRPTADEITKVTADLRAEQTIVAEGGDHAKS